jgi:nicotinate-nucleotide--dimethylbenzimidazole phosphoribosyltransferase
MSVSGLPFDDFRALVAQMAGPLGQSPELGDRFAGSGGLARLGALAGWLAAWSPRPKSLALRPLAAIFAGTHQQQTPDDEVRHIAGVMQRIERIGAGDAPIAVLCRENGVGLKALDLALEHPVADARLEPCLDEKACAATMAFGMEAIAGGTDLLCVGDIGIGNDAVSLALMAALEGDGPEAADFRDTIEGANGDPLELLRRLGGREHAALFGALVAARLERIPVIIDGYAALAALAVLHAMRANATTHCIMASAPAHPLAARTAQRCGLDAVLDLGDLSTEGCGAVVAVPVIRNAAAVAGLG